VTRDICKPIQGKYKDGGNICERLEDWDSKNHQILTWIRNTSIHLIKIQFARFDTTQGIWDLLAK